MRKTFTEYSDNKMKYEVYEEQEFCCGLVVEFKELSNDYIIEAFRNLLLLFGINKVPNIGIEQMKRLLQYKGLIKDIKIDNGKLVTYEELNL